MASAPESRAPASVRALSDDEDTQRTLKFGAAASDNKETVKAAAKAKSAPKKPAHTKNSKDTKPANSTGEKVVATPAKVKKGPTGKAMKAECSTPKKKKANTGPRVMKRPAAAAETAKAGGRAPPEKGLPEQTEAKYKIMVHNKTNTVAIRTGWGGKQVCQVGVRGATLEENMEVAKSAQQELEKGVSEEDVKHFIGLLKVSLQEKVKSRTP